MKIIKNKICFMILMIGILIISNICSKSSKEKHLLSDSNLKEISINNLHKAGSYNHIYLYF